MALSISGIVNAVNNYLYSISDVNKLLTEGKEGTTSSALSGIFEKYLNKAVADTDNISDLVNDAMNDSEVYKAVTDLNNLSTSSAFDSTASFTDSSTSALSSMFGVGLSDNTTNSNSLLSDLMTSAAINLNLSDALKGKASVSDDGTIKKTDGVENRDAIAEEINSVFSNLDIEGQIKQRFDGLDLETRINSAFENVDISSKIRNTFDNMDIEGTIEKSMEAHDKSSDISSYNSSRLQAYKTENGKNTSSSVFGDYRL